MGFVWVDLESFKTSPVIKFWVLESKKLRCEVFGFKKKFFGGMFL